jgi:hypothetical protein
MEQNDIQKQEADAMLTNLLNDGLLLPTQATTIHNLQKSSKKDVQYLLLALGLASERTLQNYLLQNYKVTSLTDPFDLPEKEALAKISKTQAAKSKLIPQKIEAGSLSVLALPPISSKSIERLRKKTGLMLIPTVITNLRFNYLLDICYGFTMDAEEKLIAIEVLEGINNKDNYFYNPGLAIYDPFSGSVKDNDPLDISKLPVEHKDLTIFEDFSQKELFLPESEMTAFFLDSSSKVPKHQGTGLLSHGLDSYEPFDIEEISTILSMVQSRDDIPHVFYSFASSSMRTATLLTCADNFALGWTGAGLGLLPQRLEGIVVPEDHGTFIADIVSEGIFLGKVKPSTVNKRLISLMGGEIDDTILGSVVSIKDRPVFVTIFLVDDDSEIEKEKEMLSSLSEAMSSCLIRLIRERKSK